MIYTVILLYPDYVTDNYGQDTWMGDGRGDTPEEALADARAQLCDPDGDSLIKAPEDLFCIAMIEGEHQDVRP
ncbi:hypothetical protein E4T66_18605 [Sinimarinibacterium sp. CAU 1509]|uniref:hypothetical protein n=1 Tax=Sinimarinibacterium sp. CAU 1509 TaxID=2562283 RepID=UPI0010AC53DD|nr:hypothetical protein [Sinimarinibacterium sp. CAU 1509]TJY57419.1 hypothetical protein E4T66_18605 [Sinimarinibacterium sp. CAU 1509]